MADWKKVGAVSAAGIVASCCFCGLVGSMVDPPSAPPSAGAPSAAAPAAPGAPAAPPVAAASGPAGGAVARAASPGAEPAPTNVLEGAQLDAAIRRAAAAVGAAESKARARDFAAAATRLDEVAQDLARPELRSAESGAALLPRVEALRAQLTALGPTLDLVARGRVAVDGEFPDALAQIEAVRSALAALRAVETPPAELARAVTKTVRDLERAESRLRERALSLQTDRDIAARGLVRISARELADVFRENEVVAETRFAGRRLAIEGVVDNISTGLFGGATAHLRTSNMFMPVDAELSRADAARLVRGTRVLLDCECTGAVIGRPQLDECRLMVWWR